MMNSSYTFVKQILNDRLVVRTPGGEHVDREADELENADEQNASGDDYPDAEGDSKPIDSVTTGGAFVVNNDATVAAKHQNSSRRCGPCPAG